MMGFIQSIRPNELHKASFLRSNWSRHSEASAADVIGVAKCSATVEGLVCGGISFFLHMRGKKRLKNFNARDWKEISRDTLFGVGRGAYRGGFIYLFTSHTGLSAPMAGLVVSVAMSIAEAAAEYSEGLVPGDVCVGRIIVGFLFSAVYAVFAKAGDLIVPLPIVGSVVGGGVGIAVFLLLKDSLRKIIEQRPENRR